MRIRNTPEMEKLWEKIEPYLAPHCSYEMPFVDDAPKEAEDALEKYRELFKAEKQKEIANFFC